jgi:hypothetical protein
MAGAPLSDVTVVASDLPLYSPHEWIFSDGLQLIGPEQYQNPPF